MIREASDPEEFEKLAWSSKVKSDRPDIVCSKEVAKHVSRAFIAFEKARSNGLIGWATAGTVTGGALATAAVVTAAAAAAPIAIALTGFGFLWNKKKEDAEIKAIEQSPLGEECIRLYRMGYRITSNNGVTLVLQAKKST